MHSAVFTRDCPATGGTTWAQRPVDNVAPLVLSPNVEETYIKSKSLIVDYLREHFKQWAALANVSFVSHRVEPILSEHRSAGTGVV